MEDSEWLVAKLDKQKLLDALVPVRTEPLPLPQPQQAPHEQQAPQTSGTGADLADDGSLPHRLHFFRGAPEAAQEYVRDSVLRARQAERWVVGPHGA